MDTRTTENRPLRRRTALNGKANNAFLIYIGIFVAVVLLGYGATLLARPAPQGTDASVAYAIQGRTHIANDAVHPPYNSNPPSSGWHYVQPARGGFYDTPLADETVIHNLEHGDIWIAYRPDISDEAQSSLKRFANQYVVISPRQENEGDISLVSWGRVDTFNLENGTVDETRIRNFIRQYDNRGPERLR